MKLYYECVVLDISEWYAVYLLEGGNDNVTNFIIHGIISYHEMQVKLFIFNQTYLRYK